MSFPITKLDSQQVLKGSYDEANQRLRVDALVSATISDVAIKDSDGNELNVNPDGSINVNVENDLNIEVSAADGDNIAISDGVHTLDILPDGSMPVTFVQTLDPLNVYNEVTSVASNVLTTILTLTATTDSIISQIDVSGTNIAEYRVLVDASIIKKTRTYFGGNLDFIMTFGEGLKITTGQVLTVRVIHLRPSLGDFNSTVSYKEI
jgi:hypothetical protein